MLKLVAAHGIPATTNAFNGLGEIEELVRLAWSGEDEGEEGYRHGCWADWEREGGCWGWGRRLRSVCVCVPLVRKKGWRK